MLFLIVNGIYTPQIGTRILTDLRIESAGQACLASHNYKPTGLVFFFTSYWAFLIVTLMKLKGLDGFNILFSTYLGDLDAFQLRLRRLLRLVPFKTMIL